MEKHNNNITMKICQGKPADVCVPIIPSAKGKCLTLEVVQEPLAGAEV